MKDIDQAGSHMRSNRSIGTRTGMVSSRFALGLALCFSGSMFATSAYAQDSQASTTNAGQAASANEDTGSGLDEIIVTATRRNENVQQVPISITALSGDKLENLGIRQSEALANLTPGLHTQGGFSQTSPQWNIRGVGSNGFFTNDVGGVGIYVDDVYILSNVGQGFQLFDTARVEVLRGPQGTLFGANTTGGAIQYVSNVPSGKNSAELSATLGNYGTQIYEGAGEFALSSKLSGRFAFMVNKNDGYFYNTYLNERDGRTDISAWRGTLRYEFSDQASATVRVWGGKSTGDELVNFMQGTYEAVDPSAGIVCSQAKIIANLCVDRRGYNESSVYSDFYTHEADQRATSRVTANGGSLTLDADLGGVNIRSITAVNKTTRDLLDDIDGSADAFSSEQWNSHSRQVSEELRISTTGNGPFKAIGGVFYLEDKGYDSYLFTFLPDYVWREFNSKATNVSVFGEISYEVTPKLVLTGGLRYSYEKRSFTNYFANFGTFATPFPTSVFLTRDQFRASETAILLDNGSIKDNWSSVSGRFIVNYKPSDDLMLYASVSRGFRGGNFNGGAFSATELTSVKPEYVMTYEAGFKSEFLDRKVRLNASGFYSNYTDLQVITTKDGVTNFGNAGKATIYGGEAELQLRPSDAFFGSFGVALLSAKYDQFLSSRGDFSGNQLENSPHFTFNGLVQYSIPVSDSAHLRLQADASYKGKNFQDFSNKTASIQDGFWLVGASLTFAPDDDRYSISVWGKNLTNTEYRRNWFDVAGLGFNGINKGEPRTYGVTFRVKID